MLLSFENRIRINNLVLPFFTVANVKGYMDPMAGAPTDFLNRINELVKLQEATKRWERTRCRRRVKRKTLPNNQTLNQLDSQN
ncbi:unnamed protein product [Trichobilharzia regenti]|nr:unnamed protein product [Trichobilharzia regenti]